MQELNNYNTMQIKPGHYYQITKQGQVFGVRVVRESMIPFCFVCEWKVSCSLRGKYHRTGIIPIWKFLYEVQL